ncbi:MULTISPECIES: 4'-phosphopantetheinyl transferase family protein [Hydrocarboniphaga]|uniref:4'-phosphopantetheinyl transferase domain-containing protein n=1 Tax=Hydrocarboniphaga effusa AP103 TaxID=1172194 RepID=I8I2G2_9GAMM|nr:MULTISPECIES: 4'-phosphopantetheinyl transferase superfamily protein [Hydrocarboniphaga]EIT70041.1 hypothetical protein WQQ_01780 [Hydrocarboniphaga effusa AP103]EIT70228.1 hypothetical protein WQQ_03650 [Hydrocarboniphaga effusa AP103]MDZ4079987.1 4'-phosphopantetheinyl transferase superfamily protein [Hydrocarboniphaga sp.]
MSASAFIFKLTSPYTLTSRMATQEEERSLQISSLQRRQEWIGARVVAKFAYLRSIGSPATTGVWSVLSDQALHEVPESRMRALWIERPQTTGTPILWDSSRKQLVSSLSLSHQYPYVAAGISCCGAIGVDIQETTAFSDDFVNHFLQAESGLLLAKAFEPPVSRHAKLTALWTLKEACFKAVSLSSGCTNLRQITIVELDMKGLIEAFSGSNSGATYALRLRTPSGLVSLGFKTINFDRHFGSAVWPSAPGKAASRPTSQLI